MDNRSKVQRCLEERERGVVVGACSNPLSHLIPDTCSLVARVEHTGARNRAAHMRRPHARDSFLTYSVCAARVRVRLCRRRRCFIGTSWSRSRRTSRSLLLKWCTLSGGSCRSSRMFFRLCLSSATLTCAVSIFSSSLPSRLNGDVTQLAMDDQRLDRIPRGRGGALPPLPNGRPGGNGLPPLHAFGAGRGTSPALPVAGVNPAFSVAGSSGMAFGAPVGPHLFPVMPTSQDPEVGGFTAASAVGGPPGAPHVNADGNRGVTGAVGNATSAPVAAVSPRSAIGGMQMSFMPPALIGSALGAVPVPGGIQPLGSGLALGVPPRQMPEEAMGIVRRAQSHQPAAGSAHSGTTGNPAGVPSAHLPGTPATGARNVPVNGLPVGSQVDAQLPSSISQPSCGGAPMSGAAAATRSSTVGGAPPEAGVTRHAAVMAPRGDVAPRSSAGALRGGSPSSESLMPIPLPSQRPRSRKRAAPSPPARQSVPSAATRGATAAPSSPALLATALSTSPQGVDDAVAKVLRDAVAKGLKDGLRGVQAEVTALRQTCSAMSTTLSALSTSVNTQGVGNERTAVALQQLSGAVRGGFSSVMDKVEPSSGDVKRKGKRVMPTPTAAELAVAAENGDEGAKRQLAVINEANLKSIRKEYQSMLKKHMFTVDVTAKCFPTTAHTRRVRIDAVGVIMKLNTEEAEAYLDSRQYYLALKKGSTPIKRRVASKLVLSLPHIFQSMKRMVVPIYLKQVKLTKKAVTSDVCELWKQDCTYAKSPRGRAGIGAAINATYRKEDILDRFITPPGVGQVPHTIASLGMYTIVSMLVRSFLDDVIAAEAKNKKGNDSGDDIDSADSDDGDAGGDDAASDRADDDDGISSAKDSRRMLYNTRWQEELVRLDRYLPRTTERLFGVALVDGDHVYRAAAGPPEGDTQAGAE